MLIGITIQVTNQIININPKVNQIIAVFHLLKNQ